jgi:hypothetical protein
MRLNCEKWRLDPSVARGQGTKPDGRLLHYSYDPAFPQGSRCRNDKVTALPRPVEDIHEALAYVARSQTRAVGGEPQVGIGNPCPPGAQPDVDLRGTYGFTDQRTSHSGQFQRNIQQMYSDDAGSGFPTPLYKQIMEDLDVAPAVWPH